MARPRIYTDEERAERKRILAKEYYLKHKEQCNAQSRKWKRENPDSEKNKRWRDLKLSHSFTITEYNSLFALQAGCCAICKRHASGFKYALSVDHNHTTGMVRGLLCPSCNQGIAFFIDSPKRLQDAATYLQQPLFKSPE